LTSRVSQVGLGIDGVELCGLDRRGDDAPVDAALIGAGEERVFAGERDRADRTLDHVGVDLDPTVVEEDDEAGRQLESVADGLGDAGAARDRHQLRVEPNPQAVDDRPALVTAEGVALFGCMAADRVFDPIECGDALQGVLGERGIAALGDLVEAAPDMAPAVGKGHRATGTSGIGQRPVVGGIAVHLEEAVEPGELLDACSAPRPGA